MLRTTHIPLLSHQSAGLLFSDLHCDTAGVQDLIDELVKTKEMNLHVSSRAWVDRVRVCVCVIERKA